MCGTSYKTTIILLVIYALGLATATFIEKYLGTQAAKTIVYYSPLFFLLQLLLILNFICSFIKHRLHKKKKWGFAVLHIAMIIILAGAFTSHLFSTEGTIHLREGASTNCMIVQTNKGVSEHKLPFELKLEKFTLTRYPGSTSPSSYESALRIHLDGNFIDRKISMNNILDIKGYRLFQASYDKDEKGSILSVNKDVAGRNITYSGYAMLIVGFILCLTGRNSRFRQLSRQLRLLRDSSKIVILLLLFSLPAYTQDNGGSRIFDIIQKNEIAAKHAATFGAIPMQSIEGRIKPVNTFSSEVLRKLYNANSIGNLNADQFILSILAMPDMWKHVPFITYSNKDIAFNYDISEGICAYIELFDTNGNYKLQQDLDKIFKKPVSQRTKYEKDLIKLDEQINIFYQLINHRMINIFPLEGDDNNKWYAYGDDLSSFLKEDSMLITQAMAEYLDNVRHGLKTSAWEKADNSLAFICSFQDDKSKSLGISKQKITTELIYNKLNIFRQCRIFYLIMGAVLLLISFLYLFNEAKWIVWFSRFLITLIIACAAYQLMGIGMRWYIAGYAPWSNSYETMVYVSFITVIAGLLFARQSRITLALATLFAGVILFVAGLNWMNPQISPLVPVLKSPWLMAHVAVIVAAYGFFGISCLLGITNLILLRAGKKGRSSIFPTRAQELSIINEMALLAGLALMTIGTFLGAVWANESWGRYWGWDPKETWALVTIVVYAIVIHLRLIKEWNNLYLFNLLSALAFACVLMTFFGVNYYMSGMHSYG